MKKLLCIDGNSILNRAYYGIRMLTNRDGFPTNALFGMVNILSKQIEALEPDYAAIAYDLKAPTFRHRMYDAYKAGRRAMPDELAQQMPVSRDFAAMLGLHILSREGYEADDILGTLARMAEESGDCTAYLLTGDRDALQLISPRVHVLLAGNNETTDMDEAAFTARYGITPDRFVDVKALMGDTSDNIPGVPGVGEKTALKLIAEYGSVDGVYAALPTAGFTPSLRRKLEEGEDSARLSRRLAEICPGGAAGAFAGRACPPPDGSGRGGAAVLALRIFRIPQAFRLGGQCGGFRACGGCRGGSDTCRSVCRCHAGRTDRHTDRACRGAGACPSGGAGGVARRTLGTGIRPRVGNAGAVEWGEATVLQTRRGRCGVPWRPRPAVCLL